MLAVVGVFGIAGGACLACGATQSRFERQIDVAGGLLLVIGLAMIGATLSAYVQ